MFDRAYFQVDLKFRCTFTKRAWITKMYESRLMLGSYFCTNPKRKKGSLDWDGTCDSPLYAPYTSDRCGATFAGLLIDYRSRLCFNLPRQRKSPSGTM